jgi:flagellar basal-body rod protein FlgF
MNISTAVATSRLIAQQRALDVTAGNLANLSTPGYKAAHVQFSDWLSRQTGAGTPRGGETVAYTQDRATWRDQRAGALNQTGNPLDLAISGDGYFTVETPQGPRLTRSGRFNLTADGTIADAAGHKLLDNAGRPIQLSTTDTRITITADGALRGETGQLAQIGVVRPQDPAQMQSEGGQLFRADIPTDVVARPGIVQGTLEASNVEPVLETTRMMRELREFQFVSQLVQTEADRQQTAIDRLLRQRT